MKLCANAGKKTLLQCTKNTFVNSKPTTMATTINAYQLRLDTISNHNRLIQQLDVAYMNHINSLLQQKIMIQWQFQQRLMQSLSKIDTIELSSHRHTPTAKSKEIAKEPEPDSDNEPDSKLTDNTECPAAETSFSATNHTEHTNLGKVPLPPISSFLSPILSKPDRSTAFRPHRAAPPHAHNHVIGPHVQHPPLHKRLSTAPLLANKPNSNHYAQQPQSHRDCFSASTDEYHLNNHSNSTINTPSIHMDQSSFGESTKCVRTKATTTPFTISPPKLSQIDKDDHNVTMPLIGDTTLTPKVPPPPSTTTTSVTSPIAQRPQLHAERNMNGHVLKQECDTDTVIDANAVFVCRCGHRLRAIKSATREYTKQYGTIFCDLCNKRCKLKQPFYHCDRGKDEPLHKDGFDVCMDCVYQQQQQQQHVQDNSTTSTLEIQIPAKTPSQPPPLQPLPPQQEEIQQRTPQVEVHANGDDIVECIDVDNCDDLLNQKWKCFYKHCGYSATNKRNLENHLQTHNNSNRPWQCISCTKSFMTREHLVVHTQSHQYGRNDQERFACNKCAYKTSKKSLLMQHERFHTGAAPIVCTYCCKQYSSKTTLQRHIKQHHQSSAK